MEGSALERYVGEAAEGQRAAAAHDPAAAGQGLRLEPGEDRGGDGRGVREGGGSGQAVPRSALVPPAGLGAGRRARPPMPL